MFQFTHPCGCDILLLKTRQICLSFNSRTRVGATYWLRPGEQDDAVSIHAPVWVRLSWAAHRARFQRFQFTHPCGCDGPNFHSNAECGGFNSRTRVGATVCIGALPEHEMFQFTHPCGCDSMLRMQSHQHGSFNSRTRVGATLPAWRLSPKLQVSIHAPVWVRLFC